MRIAENLKLVDDQGTLIKMDVDNVYKTFVDLANQYSSNFDETLALQLQKQLDVLIGVSLNSCDLKTFDPRKLLVAECFSSLVDLLNDPDIQLVIASKIIIFLQNLVSNPFLLEALQSSFQLSCSVAAFLTSSVNTERESLILQCLQLLQTMTYIKTKSLDGYHNELVNFLLDQVHNPQEEILIPSICLLANLCRHNKHVKTYIKNMDNLKAFYKLLVSMITSKGDRSVTVAALTILTNLALHDEIGDKLFQAKNIHQTFELIFNILLNGDSFVKCLAVDLFINLLESSRVHHHLIRYAHIKVCISKLIDMLTNNLAPKTAAKLMEFFHTLCSLDKLNDVILPLIFEKEVTNSQPISVAIHWSSLNADRNSEASLMALIFLQDIFKATVPPYEPRDLSSHVDEFLPIVLKDLTNSLDLEDISAKWHCQRIVYGLEILTLLATEPCYRSKIADLMNSDICINLIESQISNSNHHLNSLSVIDNNREISTDIILNVIDFVLTFANHIPEMRKVADKWLQDSQIVPFLAFSLSSDDKHRISKTLNIVQYALNLEKFSLGSLAESLSKNNANKVDSSSTVIREGNNLMEGKAMVTIASPFKRHKALESTVSALIRRMENGLDMKDLKASEIMDMYEHKIESFKLKEKQMQDLLDAKSAALQQSDRLISQYRCRWAQSDAEALKLRNLLKESEKRSELAKEQTTTSLLHQQELKKDIENIVMELQNYEQQMEEQQEVNVELTSRLRAHEQELKDSKEESSTLKEMNTMLQRHSETYKQKVDGLTQELNEIQSERKNLSKQIKEKDSKLKDLNKQYQKQNKKLQECTEEIGNVKNNVAEAQLAISTLENEKKIMQQEVSKLESIKLQNEAHIRELEEALRSGNEELEQHRKITAMIHNISSGKTNLLTNK